jgi:CheY-like chemotaxis protein
MPQPKRRRFGELLIETEIINQLTLDRALAAQTTKFPDLRLGEVLEKIGIVTSEEIAMTLATQFDLRRIQRLSSKAKTAEIKDLLPTAFCFSRLVFPIATKQGRIALAMSHPLDYLTICDVEFRTNQKVEVFVSTPAEIRQAIREHLPALIDETAPVILIADSNRESAQMTERILAELPYRVIVCRSLDETVQKSREQRPELIIAEAQVGEKQAIELMYQLHRTSTVVPKIVVLSAFSTENEILAMQEPFDDIWLKPTTPRRLQARVQRILHPPKLKTT